MCVLKRSVQKIGIVMIAVAAVLAAASVSSAQTVGANASGGGPGISIGVLGGLNMSTLAAPLVPAISQLAGASAGASVNVRFNSMVGLEVDALFMQKGAKAFDGRDKSQLRINYIDMPVMLQVGSLDSSGGIGFHALAGPTVSLKIGSTATFNDVVVTSWKDSDVKSVDLGVTLGVGVTFGQFGVSARYTMGLSTIDADTVPDEVKNRTFSALVGYRFGR